MSETEKTESFFRKVVRFVANPATDWSDLNSRQGDPLEIEKSEIKAMIERKRRNDFVRKREFDILRRMRREGLSPEQMATLGGSSRLDDSEARLSERPTARPAGVKAKIDEIEQQMVGDAGFSPSTRRTGSAPRAPPAPAPLPLGAGDAAEDGWEDGRLPALPALPEVGLPALRPGQTGRGLPARAPLSTVSSAATLTAEPNAQRSARGSRFAVDVSEVVHDQELDEAVIAFANADFNQCELALQQITRSGGARAQDAETWMVLFDLYCATGQQQPFEALALEYARQFGWSAPQWYSLPQRVAQTLAAEPEARAAATRSQGDVGWVGPERLDVEAVARLRSLTLQLPLPWVFDWSGLKQVDAEAAMRLSLLFRLWAGQALELRWLGAERLFDVLQESAPTGVRDADPAFWLARLDALRLVNRPDQFDEVAIDYCITYEVSPPSWEPTRCKVHIAGAGAAMNTRTPPMSLVSEVSTGFLESGLKDEPGGGVEVAHVELSGQLVGDIGPKLDKLQGQLGHARRVSVSCSNLIRVDFMAAGDLLNWLLSRRSEGLAVEFVDTHRLVALFFSAVGIGEHAKVQVRTAQ